MHSQLFVFLMSLMPYVRYRGCSFTEAVAVNRVHRQPCHSNKRGAVVQVTVVQSP